MKTHIFPGLRRTSIVGMATDLPQERRVNRIPCRKTGLSSLRSQDLLVSGFFGEFCGKGKLWRFAGFARKTPPHLHPTPEIPDKSV